MRRSRTLNDILKVTDEEYELLDWSFRNMDENEIAACQTVAADILRSVIQDDDVAGVLTGTLASIAIRAVRSARLGASGQHDSTERRRKQSRRRT